MMNFYKSEEEFYSEMAEKVKDVISTDKKSLFYNSNKPVSYELSSITILLYFHNNVNINIEIRRHQCFYHIEHCGKYTFDCLPNCSNYSFDDIYDKLDI